MIIKNITNRYMHRNMETPQQAPTRPKTDRTSIKMPSTKRGKCMNLWQSDEELMPNNNELKMMAMAHTIVTMLRRPTRLLLTRNMISVDLSMWKMLICYLYISIWRREKSKSRIHMKFCNKYAKYSLFFSLNAPNQGTGFVIKRFSLNNPKEILVFYLMFMYIAEGKISLQKEMKIRCIKTQECVWEREAMYKWYFERERLGWMWVWWKWRGFDYWWMQLHFSEEEKERPGDVCRRLFGYHERWLVGVRVFRGRGPKIFSINPLMGLPLRFRPNK